MEPNLKQTEKENLKENKREKKSFNLSTIERILFSLVFVLFGVIILINTVNTVDFQPTVKYISNSSADSSKPESVIDSSEAHTTSTLDNNTQTNQTSSQSAALVNINTASLEELMILNGIGQVKAQAIIDYRTQNGKFDSIDELLNVEGIGERILEKFRSSITIN